MSLAVLPSSPVTTFNQHDYPTSPSPSKRPKLSLDTSSVASTGFGKKAGGLRLETLSATSPTIRHTFINTHDNKPARPSLMSLSTTFSDSPTTETPSQDDVPDLSYPDKRPSTSSTTSSTSSVSTLDSFIGEAPYKLPFNHASILKNGPVDHRSTTSFSAGAPKLMFPPAKRVAFKASLTEDVVTTKFTLRHSDIPEPAAEEAILDDAKAVQKKSKLRIDGTIRSPHTGDKRESSDEEDDEDDDNALYPTTPVAGRRKRHRQWVWTLGPAESEAPVLHVSTTEDVLAAGQ